MQKVNAKEIRMEYSELGIIPMEFIIHSSLKEISPMFAKYWKYQKKALKEGKGICDIDMDYYQFSKEMPNRRQVKNGLGLVHMLNSSINCGFYMAQDNTLLTYIAFAKKR